MTSEWMEATSEWMELANARAARMSAAFRDIIDLCKHAPATYRASPTHEEWLEFVSEIDDIAHRGLYGESECS